MKEVAFFLCQWSVPDRQPINCQFSVAKCSVCEPAQCDVPTSLGCGGESTHFLISALEHVVNVQFDSNVHDIDRLEEIKSFHSFTYSCGGIYIRWIQIMVLSTLPFLFLKLCCSKPEIKETKMAMQSEPSFESDLCLRTVKPFDFCEFFRNGRSPIFYFFPLLDIMVGYAS